MDVKEEAVLAGQSVRRSHLIELLEEFERLGHPRVRRTEPDDGVNVQPDLRGIDHGRISLDHAASLQPLDPRGHGRLGQVHPAPDIGSAQSPVLLQDREDLPIDLVQWIHLLRRVPL